MQTRIRGGRSAPNAETQCGNVRTVSDFLRFHNNRLLAAGKRVRAIFAADDAAVGRLAYTAANFFSYIILVLQYKSIAER